MKEIKQNGARNEKGRLDMYARTHHPSALIRAFERTMNSVPVPKKKKKKRTSWLESIFRPKSVRFKRSGKRLETTCGLNPVNRQLVAAKEKAN